MHEGAVEVVHHRPFHGGHRAAGGDHVVFREVDEQVAVGMGGRQVAVGDGLAREVELAGVEGRLRRARFGRQGLDHAGVEGRMAVAAEIKARHFMGDDHAARLAHRFVAADLLGMPVGVDQGLDAVGLQGAGNRLEQGGRLGRGTAVDQQHAVRARQGDDVAAAGVEHRQAIDVLDPYGLGPGVRAGGMRLVLGGLGQGGGGQQGGGGKRRRGAAQEETAIDKH